MNAKLFSRLSLFTLFSTCCLTASLGFSQMSLTTQQLIEDLKNQKNELDHKSENLTKDEELLKQEQERLAQEQNLKNEKIKELQKQKEELLKAVQSPVSFQNITDVLLSQGNPSQVGNCRIQSGKAENEIYVESHKQRIRVIFATNESPLKPVASYHRSGEKLLIQIQQKEFDPADLTKKEGPMKAQLLFEQKTVDGKSVYEIYQAQFSGQAIGDRLGYFSSGKKVALTCLRLEQENIF